MASDRARRRRRGLLYLILGGVAALIVVAGLIALKPVGTPIYWVVRGAAMLGYLCIFLAIVSSNYLRQVTKFFGRPFIGVHHIISVAGLALVTLHPLTVAGISSSLTVFLPSFDSLNAFLRLGGRPAWYLFGVAVLTALLRKRIGQNWRVIHFLNYVAFLLGTVHAMMIGTDFDSLVMKVIAGAMGLAVVGIFVQKRVRRRRLMRKAREKRG